jgi:hypothetical protein
MEEGVFASQQTAIQDEEVVRSMVVVVGVLIFRLLYSGGVDVTLVYPLAIGFGLACAILIPMKIVRGCFSRRQSWCFYPRTPEDSRRA